MRASGARREVIRTMVVDGMIFVVEVDSAAGLLCCVFVWSLSHRGGSIRRSRRGLRNIRSWSYTRIEERLEEYI